MTFHQDLNGLQRQTLERVLEGSAPSRFELSNLFGVSPQTMTRAVKGLVEHGILDEQPDTSGGRGQPSRRLVFREESLLVIGLVVDDHRLVVTVEDLAGTRLRKEECYGDFRDPYPALERASALLQEAFDAFGGPQRMVGMGIAAQGFFSERGRRIISNGNPIAWSKVDLKAYFEDRFALPVTVHNDAKAVAAGTIREGLARQHSHYFCFYIAGGVGGALVHDGKLYEGQSANAGEVGYFVPRDEYRPTVRNFLKAARISELSDWNDSIAHDEQTIDWCAGAGRSLSLVAQMCVRMYDISTIFIASALPATVLAAICRSVHVEPIGSNLLSEEDGRRLLTWPSVIAINDTSVNHGACALAAYHFLRFTPQTTPA